MSASKRGWVVVLLLGVCGRVGPGAALGGELASKVEEYMAARVGFHGSILVARDGEPPVRLGYGRANREHDVPNTPETKFRIGSITKQFTAMAVMILQEKGKLDVREKVRTYLPDSPKAWDEVTVHHLLTHTSGIPSYTSLPDFLKTMALPATPEQIVARVKDRPLEFKPGAKFAYSNSGYIVLGLLIDKVSGTTYGNFLHEHIFGPLKMKDTGIDRALPIKKHRASGYSQGPFAVVNAQYIDMSLPYAAGALDSTVDDLLLWDRALSGEALVKQTTLKAIFTPEKQDYGYGWIVGKSFGRAEVSHGGGINGFASHIARFPEAGLCVVVLSNVEGAPVAAVAHDLAAIALGEKYTVPGRRKEVAVDRKLYDAYDGVYDVDLDAPKLTFTITREGDRLWARLTGQSRFEIFPESETEFFYKVVEARITFVKDGEGKVTHLVLHQNGRDLKATRRAPGEKP